MTAAHYTEIARLQRERDEARRAAILLREQCLIALGYLQARILISGLDGDRVAVEAALVAGLEAALAHGASGEKKAAPGFPGAADR